MIVLASVFFYDIWFYISHIILHTKNMYYYHKLHHKNMYPRFLDTYEGHILEGPFQGIGMVIPFLFLDYTLVDIFLILLFLNARGMMRHDKRCSFIVGDHHLLHHKYPNYNFGEYWIDWICGTLYNPRVDDHAKSSKRSWEFKSRRI
jgi:sterol desaturase/sphingolipid hydroxylase (fatty acid hydroxylase superfamily)